SFRIKILCWMLCFFFEAQAGSKSTIRIKYRMFIKMNIGIKRGWLSKYEIKLKSDENFALKNLFLNKSYITFAVPSKERGCPDGGIGRRARLKIWFSQGSAGSIPVLGTPIKKDHLISGLFLLVKMYEKRLGSFYKFISSRIAFFILNPDIIHP